MTNAQRIKMLKASHVTYGQCARIVGVGNQAVRHRVAAGHMTPIEIAGVKMIARDDVALWIVEQSQREGRAAR